MVNAESDLGVMLNDKEFGAAKQEKRPGCISVFYPLLKSHEGTMLFAISNDQKSLATFATTKHDFYSRRFMAVCRIVLRNVHKTTPQSVLKQPVARV